MYNYKISIFSLALCALIFSGCKKDDKKDNTDLPVTVSDNTWAVSDFDQIKFTTFTVGSSSHYAYNAEQRGLLFKDSKTGSKATLYVLFKTVPTATGKYKIVRYEGSAIENDDECSVVGSDESGSGFYCFYLAANSTIDVTLKKDGKLAITIPEINVTYAAPSGVYKLKATVYEK